MISGTAVAMLHEHGMNVVKRVLEERLYTIETVNVIHFGFMPEIGQLMSYLS